MYQWYEYGIQKPSEGIINNSKVYITYTRNKTEKSERLKMDTDVSRKENLIQHKLLKGKGAGKYFVDQACKNI